MDEDEVAAAIREQIAQLLALIADRDATIERYERLLSEKSAQLESGIAALRAEALAMLPLARAQQEAIERVRALCDDVDKKYMLVDDNTNFTRPERRLFLLLDDVRKALGDA